jgi:hypothetical protein
MWVEAITKLCVKLPEGSLILEPGRPVNIPKEQAQLLIKRAQGKVRPWDHAKTGRIVLVTEDGWIVVHENMLPGRLVFLRVDEGLRMRRDSASC